MVRGEGRKKNTESHDRKVVFFSVFSNILISQVENGLGVNAALVCVEYLLISPLNRELVSGLAASIATRFSKNLIRYIFISSSIFGT